MMEDFPQTAMLLAAGYGMRMRPLTDHLPKPLIRVHGKPLIDWNLDWLKQSGVKRVVVNTAYLADLLEDYLRKRQDIEILISREPSPMETGGGIRSALPLLGNAPFFVVNSDSVWIERNTQNGILAELAKQYYTMTPRPQALLAVYPHAEALGYEGRGDFTCEDGCLEFRNPEVDAPYVYTGIQLMDPAMLEGCTDESFPLTRCWRRSPGNDRLLINVAGYPVTGRGQWLHIGDPAGLSAAEGYFRASLAV